MINPITDDKGTKRWFKGKKLHRLDGPAIEFVGGTKFWFIDGFYHREDGPAIEYSSGEQWWYQNNVKHRLDGPALIWSNGNKEWWYKGKFIKCSSQEEFEKLIKLRAFW